MSPETLAIIGAYLMCSEAAEVRMLDASEVEVCTALYLEVKLGFVPDVGIHEYQLMSAIERAETNQQGYEGYVAWRASNPDLATETETIAELLSIGRTD